MELHGESRDPGEVNGVIQATGVGQNLKPQWRVGRDVVNVHVIVNVVMTKDWKMRGVGSDQGEERKKDLHFE